MSPRRRGWLTFDAGRRLTKLRKFTNDESIDTGHGSKSWKSEGHRLRRPLADYLKDGIYELRPSHAGQHYRILYFFAGEKVIVLSHGLVKERAVPPTEIARALERRARYLRDPERHAFRPEEGG